MGAREERRFQLTFEASAGNSPERLLSHLGGRTGLAESRIEVGRSAYSLLHPADADALIDEEEFDQDERLPYWAELWPSAIVLARYLDEQNLAGTRTVELGCGIGLPSIVALERGASALATDHYEAALEFAAYNAEKETGRVLATAHLDWRAPRTEDLGHFNLLFAADVLYERPNHPLLGDLVGALLSPGGEAIFADPRRKDTPEFIRMMEDRGFSITTGSASVERRGKPVEVHLHRLCRG